jgi:hypothetical protein
VNRLSAPTEIHADSAPLMSPPALREQGRAAEATSPLAVVGTIASETALFTGVLYYFGWVRAHASLGYFGVDPGLVGFSTPDYVLRSINVAFLPFFYAAIAALMLLGLHRFVVLPTLDRAGADSPQPPDTSGNGDSGRPYRAHQVFIRVVSYPLTLGDDGRGTRRVVRWFVGIVETVAGGLGLVVIVGVLFPAQVGVPLGLTLPVLLLASISLFGYVAYLRSRFREQFASTMRSLRGDPPSRVLSLFLLSLGLLASLWVVSLYGGQVGIRIATDFARHLPTESEVVVYSTERIALLGPGVVVTEITQPGTKYHYQYTGLRLLAHSPDKYLLLPMGWQRGRDRVFLVRDDDSIRADIAAL